jgi:hypothetical protein
MTHRPDNLMRIFLSLVAVLVALSGCGGDSSPKPLALSPLAAVTVDVDRGELLDYSTEGPATDFGATHDYSLSELSTRAPVAFTVHSATDGAVKINGVLVPTNKAYPVTMAQIGDSDSIVIEYQDQQASDVMLTVHARPTSLPQYWTTGRISVPGELALTAGSATNRNYLLLLDSSGNIVFYRRASDADGQFSDFKRHDLADGTFYTYMNGSAVLPIGYLEGQVSVMDANFKTLYTVPGVLPNAAISRPLVRSENHDFMLLGRNHYVVSGYQGLVSHGIAGIADGMMIVNNIFQEVDNGSVVVEWQSIDHPEMFTQSEEGNGYNAQTWSDYAHFNSIDIDPRDSNFVVSFRSLNSFWKIHRTTGQTIWRFGGTADEFGVAPVQMPQGQHDVRMQADGSIMYFDNGTTCNGIAPQLSRFWTPVASLGGQTLCDVRGAGTRLVKVSIDEAAHAVSSYQEWRVANSASVQALTGKALQFTSYRGSVMLMPNGDLLAGFGSKAAPERDVVEWDPVQGAAVFELYFDLGGARPDQATVSSYRAAFFPNH